METPSDSPFISQASRPRRVAIKFLDDFKRPDKFKLLYEDGAERSFPKDLRRRWNELKEMFPRITLKRVFFTVAPERIQEMIAEAQVIMHDLRNMLKGNQNAFSPLSSEQILI